MKTTTIDPTVARVDFDGPQYRNHMMLVIEEENESGLGAKTRVRIPLNHANVAVLMRGLQEYHRLLTAQLADLVEVMTIRGGP